MIRAILRSTLEERGRASVVGEGGTGIEALELCRELEPDVLVLDLSLPRLDGLEVVRRLRAEGWPGRILVLSGRADLHAILGSAIEGADSYLDKTSPPEEVAAAVEGLPAGGGVVSIEHRTRAYEGLVRMAREARASAELHASLTPRQRQLLLLLTRGLTSRQIATRMQISARTVEDHIVGLYDKLEVRTRTQALTRAAAMGLVRIE